MNGNHELVFGSLPGNEDALVPVIVTDGSVEIVVGDVTDIMSLSAFEEAQAVYNGIDTRGTPIIDYEAVSTDTFFRW